MVRSARRHDEALGVAVKELHWGDFLNDVEQNRPEINPPDTLYFSDILNSVEQQLVIQDKQESCGEGNPWPIDMKYKLKRKQAGFAFKTKIDMRH